MHDEAISLREYVDIRLRLLEQTVSVALAASEKAVLKAEAAADRRFEGVNEFRSALSDQQKTFIPRAEVQVMESANAARIAALEKQHERLVAERAGIRGGYGYAVGVVGFILTLVSLGVVLLRAFKP